MDEATRHSLGQKGVLVMFVDKCVVKLYRWSPSSPPYKYVNCACLPDKLLNSAVH
jgi:hypothetical protein